MTEGKHPLQNIMMSYAIYKVWSYSTSANLICLLINDLTIYAEQLLPKIPQW